MLVTMMTGNDGDDDDGANDNTLSKMEFSPSHLQVVHVFDSFDVSDKQVRMNFNGSGRLRKLSLKLFEKQICIYSILSLTAIMNSFGWIFASPVLCSIPSSDQ